MLLGMVWSLRFLHEHDRARSQHVKESFRLFCTHVVDNIRCAEGVASAASSPWSIASLQIAILRTPVRTHAGLQATTCLRAAVNGNQCLIIKRMLYGVCSLALAASADPMPNLPHWICVSWILLICMSPAKMLLTYQHQSNLHSVQSQVPESTASFRRSKHSLLNSWLFPMAGAIITRYRIHWYR